MKKVLFFAAVALVALASCSDETFVGEVTTVPQDNSPSVDNAIVFSSVSKGTTRADHVGADAANLLGSKFIVGGFKGDGSAMSEVFNNYYVSWTENTAGKTESNTSDWEYVGAEAKAPSTLPSGAIQSIKYWDYNTSQYDFAAYSTGKLAAGNVLTSGTTTSEGQVLISPITKKMDGDTYKGLTYTLKGDVAALKECYISNMVTAYYPSDYQKEVLLTFRNLSSKVRVALYETVPGYSVKDVNFYTVDNSNDTDIKATGTGSGQLNNTKVTLFTTGSETSDKFFTSGTYTVTFPTIGSSNVGKSDYNLAHVSFAADASGSGTTQEYGSLNYFAAPENKETGVYLGRTSNNPSYAGTASPWYTTVLPNETGTILELRINYTLVATDGSGEEIHIHGAKALVPAIYATWKPNYAYTYLFKISDNTNGWTSTTHTDPAGLYPITFDAVVVDSEEFTQSTITTVATPSITTYQKGHDVSKNEYNVNGEDIYIQVMDNSSIPGSLKNDLNDSKHHLWKVTKTSDCKVEISEATVMDAINIRESYSGGVLKGRNGLILTLADMQSGFTTIPGVDGNNITIEENTAAKFEPETSTIYAYAYTIADNRNTTFPTGYYFETEPSNWSSIYGSLYKDKEFTTPADATFAKGDYYKKVTNYNIDLAVKVIKVQ